MLNASIVKSAIALSALVVTAAQAAPVETQTPRIQTLSCASNTGVFFTKLDNPNTSSTATLVQTQWGLLTKTFKATLEEKAEGRTHIVLKNKTKTYSIALPLDVKSEALQHLTGELLTPSTVNEGELVELATVDCRVGLQL